MLFTFLLTFDKHNVNSKIYVQSVKILLNLILRQRLQACMRHETLQRFLPKIFFHLELKYFSDIPPFVFVIEVQSHREMNSFAPFLVLSTLHKLLFNFIKTLSF